MKCQFQFLSHIDIFTVDITEAAVQRCSWEKVFWIYAENLQENTHSEVRFNKVAMQLYWNYSSAWVFSSKFAAYFQNILS